MHPPAPPTSTDPVGAGESLTSSLVSSSLTLVSIAAAVSVAVPTGTALASVPTLAVPAAILLGLTTLIAVPLTTTVLSRTILETLERNHTEDTTAERASDDRLPTSPTHSRR